MATYQAGMRAITGAGGANAYVLGDSLDITPCFLLASARDAIAFSQWLNDPKFAEIIAATLVGGELAIAAALANGRFIEAHLENRERTNRSAQLDGTSR